MYFTLLTTVTLWGENYIGLYETPRGGGGGQGATTKPILTFRGHFGRKQYPYLRI